MILKKGDSIGIIALSGDCERDKVLDSVSFIESCGYNVKLSKNIYDKKNYLAGNDEDKVEELHKFFLDNDIKLILAARGGYGVLRIINKIDYNVIKNNLKPFCGYSDVTAILLMIYKNTGMEVYHGPMACTDFIAEDEFTQKCFFDALGGSELTYESKKIPYFKGSAKGILWGGNLSTVVSLCGMDFIPEKDFIFFAEDINEPVYKIDKMFQQLINTSKFTKYCKGFVLGDFSGLDNEKWLNELFFEISERLQIPVVGGFKIGHLDKKITIPIGRNCILEDNLLKVCKK